MYTFQSSIYYIWSNEQIAWLTHLDDDYTQKYGEESKGRYSHITETMFSCVSGIGNVREYRKIYFTINYVLHKSHKADEKGLIGLDTFFLDLDQQLNSG